MRNRTGLMLATFLTTAMAPFSAMANVITDWDQIAQSTIQPAVPSPAIIPALGYRNLAMVHMAMFNAVNCIEPRYQSYGMQLEPSLNTSMDAAAATAAATVLMKVIPSSDEAIKKTLAEYMAKLPSDDETVRGVKLGEDVAARVIALRANDGANAKNDFRPVTQPGVYLPTTLPIGPEFGNVKPFVLKDPAQFRPGPPVDLKSEQWAKDYNEIKDLGERDSKKRTARQTEDARFWLTTGLPAYQPLIRQLVAAKNMSTVDSARFMTVLAITLADNSTSFYAAKWHYKFWRPITAIRNGDIDDNPATERVATWEPIALTPLHPEYPCAHCAGSAAVAAAATTLLGGDQIPEVSQSNPTAPGVTHKYKSLNEITKEASNGRIYAGFHYRFSTIAGSEMGKNIGDYVAKNALLPLMLDQRRRD